MKAAKLRDMTVDELRLQETQITDQVFRLRFQVAAGQIENPSRVHELRKDLARVKTVLNEKARGAAAAPPPVKKEKTARKAKEKHG